MRSLWVFFFLLLDQAGAFGDLTAALAALCHRFGYDRCQLVTGILDRRANAVAGFCEGRPDR